MQNVYMSGYPLKLIPETGFWKNILEGLVVLTVNRSLPIQKSLSPVSRKYVITWISK